MTVAARVAGLRTSPIRSIALGAPEGAVSLALGEPGWPVPEVARTALAAWAQESTTCAYGPNEGLPELVSAVAARHGVEVPEVMVTAGSQAALYAVFQAHVPAGSRVLVPDPGFVAYPTLATLAGARATAYRLGAGGALDPEAVTALLDEHDDVSLVVLNHPGNPTGGGATVQALAAVAQACERRGAVLVSDEVYRELHRGTPQPSLRAVTTTGLVLESVSKAWAAPGLRVGWAVGPAALLAPARLVHNAMTTAPARPSQVAAAALLRASATVLEHSRAEVQRRWALLDGGPIAAGGAAGGFYLWAPLPAWAGEDDTAFVCRVRDEAGVVLVPGSAFGDAGRGHVRVSLGGDPEQLTEGLARLAPWWEGPC
jgi:aspartate aminotransferase